MSKSLQAIRGMNDILPEQTPAWRYLERTFAGLLDGYGYSEIRLPILEFTELFARGIGEGTDVVDKEMYTFLDRNGESLTMRPEGTAGCVRAVLEHGLSGGGQVQKLWYTGPMFRYEKPQKGRYRQFHQIGVEVFNLPGPDIDAELIILNLGGDPRRTEPSGRPLRLRLRRTGRAGRPDPGRTVAQRHSRHTPAGQRRRR